MPVEKQFIINGLRRMSYRHPQRSIALKRAKVAYGTYTCAYCLVDNRRKDVQVDHIDPVVDPRSGWVDYNTFIERLFCGADGLQVLCKTCHSSKSKSENKNRVRRKYVNTEKRRKRK